MPALYKDDQEWSHPLIMKPTRNFSRRHLIGVSGGAIAGLTLLPSVRDTFAQEGTPVTEITGSDEAVELLKQAVNAMTALETFHFLIETTSGTTEILDILEIETIEGDVRRPYDFQTTVRAKLFMGTIEVNAVGIDGRIQIEDPTSTAGGWIDLGTDTATLSLLNPDYLFLQAVGIVQDAELGGDEEFDGQPARKVIGTVSFANVASDIFGEETPLPTELSNDPLDISIWINEENLVLGVELLGAVLATEDEDVTRLITFSAFNEPVEIVAPES
jgi:hypothetical protein